MEWLGRAVAILSSGALIAHHVVTCNISEGPSMFPTIASEHSYLVMSCRHKRGKDIKVGDVIVFAHPDFAGQRACKRVIGMPGDYVVRDEHVFPTVGVAATPILEDKAPTIYEQEPVMIQVPEGHVWVAGDNLSASRDSRFFGPLPMALIKGKTIYSSRRLSSGWISFREPQLQPVSRTIKATKKESTPD